METSAVALSVCRASTAERLETEGNGNKAARVVATGTHGRESALRLA